MHNCYRTTEKNEYPIGAHKDHFTVIVMVAMCVCVWCIFVCPIYFYCDNISGADNKFGDVRLTANSTKRKWDTTWPTRTTRKRMESHS